MCGNLERKAEEYCDDITRRASQSQKDSIVRIKQEAARKSAIFLRAVQEHGCVQGGFGSGGDGCGGVFGAARIDGVLFSTTCR